MLPELELEIIGAGFLIGFLLGLTGIGGGALMTFGHAPQHGHSHWH